jgi:hypothetical protein
MTASGPQAVYPADMPLSLLRTAELLPVVTLRLFALPWCAPGEHHPDWRDGLSAAGIGETGVPAFHALFTLVATTPRRALDVRCRHCRRLGHDEGLLLRLISLLQSGWAPDASAILEDWLPPAAARMAMLPAHGLADAMKTKGLVVPLRHREAGNLPKASLGCRDRGLALVQ